MMQESPMHLTLWIQIQVLFTLTESTCKITHYGRDRSKVACQPNQLSPLLYTNHSTLPKANDHFCHTINLYHDNYKYTTNLKIT
jgi:hypothetical protein